MTTDDAEVLRLRGEMEEMAQALHSLLWRHGPLRYEDRAYRWRECIDPECARLRAVLGDAPEGSDYERGYEQALVDAGEEALRELLADAPAAAPREGEETFTATEFRTYAENLLKSDPHSASGRSILAMVQFLTTSHRYAAERAETGRP